MAERAAGFGGGFSGFGGGARGGGSSPRNQAATGRDGIAAPTRGDVPPTADLVAAIPSLVAVRTSYGAYAGIGSRETPQDVCDDMTAIAAALEARGFTLRSGFAGGADTAFELGTTRDDLREVFAPWRGFGANPDSPHEKKRWDQIRRHEGITGERFVPAKARLLEGAMARRSEELAAPHHPNWDRLKSGARQLHSRNMGQVYGPTLDVPALFEIAYTVDGQATGGTGQAIRVAQDAGIPVLNVHDGAVRDVLMKELGIERTRVREADRRPSDLGREEARRRASPAEPARSKEAKPFDLVAAAAPEQRWDKARSSVFLKVQERFGGLSNMSNAHPYRDGGVEWGSTEAQFQALRFPDHPEIQEEVRRAHNAYAAKQVAYAHIDESRSDWEEVNLAAMAYVLTRKHDASPAFREELAEATKGGRTIVEWSRKSQFWGAAPDGQALLGQNVLGRLLNQLDAGARQDELPPGSKLIGKEAVAAAPAKYAGTARVASAEPQGPGAIRYRPGADVSGMKADVIVNTVNANLSRAGRNGTLQDGNPVMGKGVAKAFADRYGDALLRPYADAIRRGGLKAGGVQMLRMPDGQVVANLATKQDWRDPSRMEWVESGLKALAEEMRRGGHDSVAIPPPGCGNGGLDWKEVEPLVAKHLAGFDVTITAAPSGAVTTARSGAEVGGVEGRAAVLEARRDEARWAAGREAKSGAEPQMRASMYFSYGRDRRPGVEAASTFEAILSGERTSTTRFDSWNGSDRWGRLGAGAVVRMFEDKEMKGRFVDVRIASVERLDLGRASPERLEEWSKAEGWSVEHGRAIGSRGGAWQVRYEPVPGQEILKERAPSPVDREADDLPLLAAARGRRLGFGR